MITHVSFRTLRALKSLVPATGALAALLTASAAHAQLIAYGDTGQPTEAQFNALGVTAVPITGNPPDTFRPYQTTVGTEMFTLSNGGTAANGKILERRNQQGGGIPANNGAYNFPVATPLLRNVVSATTSNTADGLLFTFSSPISAFGFNYDPTLVGRETDFTFQVTEISGNTPLTQLSETNTGQAPPNAGNATAPFFGVQEAGGNLITSILIVGSATPGAAINNTAPNDFAVGLLRFGVTAPMNVPEPGNVALLLGMAVTGAGCLARRKRSSINK